MSFQAGDTIGDYEILGPLGRGGMGRVFRARNVISNRVDAMKVVLPDLESDPGLADRFLREIQVHASLNHPNIARMYTALRAEGRLVMVLEFVDGESLDERLRRGPLPLNEAVDIVIQVLSALSYAHACGVVHRDLKPANIIVNKMSKVKLTDFGIAQSAGAPRLTRSGAAIGSLYYLSPEQVKMQSVDARSDVYSLGVTFFELITGKRPIEGRSEYSVMNAHLTHIPVSPSSINPLVPAPISAIILKALEKEPDARFQSAHEFQSELLFLDSQPAEVDRTGALTAPARPALDPELIPRLEARLLPVLGPVAPRLVEREARNVASSDELVLRLADHIPGPSEREEFLQAFPSRPEPPQKTGAKSRTPIPTRTLEPSGVQPLNPATVDAASKRLARYIGPIAGVVAKQAAKKARSQQEFYELLAAEIASGSDRAAFLSSFAL